MHYSEPFFEGAFRQPGPVVEGFASSPSYQSAVSTRALIYVEADNLDIGTVFVMPIGLVEISSCEVTVQQGQSVEKGDELGMVCRPTIILHCEFAK